MKSYYIRPEVAKDFIDNMSKEMKEWLGVKDKKPMKFKSLLEHFDEIGFKITPEEKELIQHMETHNANKREKPNLNLGDTYLKYLREVDEKLKYYHSWICEPLTEKMVIDGFNKLNKKDLNMKESKNRTFTESQIIKVAKNHGLRIGLNNAKYKTEHILIMISGNEENYSICFYKQIKSETYRPNSTWANLWIDSRQYSSDQIESIKSNIDKLQSFYDDLYELPDQKTDDELFDELVKKVNKTHDLDVGFTIDSHNKTIERFNGYTAHPKPNDYDFNLNKAKDLLYGLFKQIEQHINNFETLGVHVYKPNIKYPNIHDINFVIPIDVQRYFKENR